MILLFQNYPAGKITKRHLRLQVPLILKRKELVFRRALGADEGTCPPAGGAVARENSPPDCFLTRALRILLSRKKQKRIPCGIRLWRAT
ncbi:MAG: hypothetical protein IKY86_04550, partial [Clostridia bacterium]|nr:hypothetical protein [Clostridia bacterium]